MNSRTAAEETTIAALVFMDIGFDLLWKRNYSLRANRDIISALMPDYCALLRAKMTFSNRPAQVLDSRSPRAPQAFTQKDLPRTFHTAVWCIFLPARKVEIMRFHLALIIMVTAALLSVSVPPAQAQSGEWKQLFDG